VTRTVDRLPSLLRTGTLAAWFLYLLLNPVHAFPLGTPQPSDYLLAGLSLVTLVGLRGPLPAAQRRFATVMWIGVAYITAVNLTWTVQTGRTEIALNAAYYVFNGLAVTTFFLLHARYGELFLRVTVVGIVLALFLQIGLIVGFGNVGASRATLLAAKPNQLGYFAVLGATIYLFARDAGVAGRLQSQVWSVAILSGAGLLSVVAISRAAMAGVLAALAVAFLRRPSGLIAVVAAGLLVGFASGPRLVRSLRSVDVEAVDRIQRRMVMMAGRGAEEILDERGYARIIEQPQYTLFGAGEGAEERWVHTGRAQEVHSTVANLFFAYGIVGLGWLILLLYSIGAKGGAWALIYLVPVFVYGTTHNGARETLFWVALTMAFTLGRRVRGARARTGSGAPGGEPATEPSPTSGLSPLARAFARVETGSRPSA